MRMNEMSVPGYVLNQKFMPAISRNGTVSYRRARQGDWCIRVRPPCMWSGGAQLMKIVAFTSSGCLGFPTLACAPYGGDCDVRPLPAAPSE